MKTTCHRKCRRAFCVLAAFVCWTAAVLLVDVQAIGPQGSAVGFAAVNCFFHDLTGVHMTLYLLTDWLSLIPLCTAAGFSILGLAQWIRRKSILRVDAGLLLLGGFYLTVIAIYGIFEQFAFNYRPVLIDGILEASYPSSTTLLVLCVMSTAGMQLHARVRRSAARRLLCTAIAVFTVFMVIGRLLSGVHWLTDIIGGILLSTGLVLLYDAFRGLV